MKLLQIDSSSMGEAAISRQLTKESVQRWGFFRLDSKPCRRIRQPCRLPSIVSLLRHANEKQHSLGIRDHADIGEKIPYKDAPRRQYQSDSG
jgi:hypothetical protein